MPFEQSSLTYISTDTVQFTKSVVYLCKTYALSIIQEGTCTIKPQQDLHQF